ncbi:hypothetical protein D3C76_1179510 [compost metagenome]
MSVPIVEFHGDRHALTESIVGISDDNAQAIDEVGAQVWRFNGFWCEFGGRGDKPDFPVVRLIRPPVGVEQQFAPRLGLIQIRFINVCAHPHRAGEGERQHGAACAQHAAGLDGAGHQRAVRRRDQRGVVQVQLGLRQLRLSLFETGFSLGDILRTVPGAVLA